MSGDGGDRMGLPQRRRHDRRPGRQQRPPISTYWVTTHCLALLGILLCGFALAGCRSTRSPQDTYNELRQRTRRGELDAALREADQAYREYFGKSAEWAWRFRVQKAHILVLRGSTNAAIELLTENLPASLASSDIALPPHMILALPPSFSTQFDQAESDLSAAEQLARSSQPALLGDVMQSRGILEFDRK